MKQDLFSTCVWLLLKSVLAESIMAMVIITLNENLFFGLGIAVLGFILAAIFSLPLLLIVCPIVRISLSIPYSFIGQLIWMIFALGSAISLIFLAICAIAFHTIDDDFIYFFVSLFISVGYGCYTSASSLAKYRSMLNASNSKNANQSQTS